MSNNYQYIALTPQRDRYLKAMDLLRERINEAGGVQERQPFETLTRPGKESIVYMESDRDYVMNNIEAAVALLDWFLEAKI